MSEKFSNLADLALHLPDSAAGQDALAIVEAVVAASAEQVPAAIDRVVHGWFGS